MLLCCVLDNVAEGKTQLSAFYRAGKELGRTAEACGYRWNSILRKQHQKEFTEARKAYLKVKEKQKRKNKPTPKKATPKQRKEYVEQAKQYFEAPQEATPFVEKTAYIGQGVRRINPITIEIKEYNIRITQQELHSLCAGKVPEALRIQLLESLPKSKS